MAKSSLVTYESLTEDEKCLVKAARRAARFAYTPYFNFPVGAAILTASNKTYTGCNIENCSAGNTICAERVAAMKAVSAGHRRFKAIAIFAPLAPKRAGSCGCGICRQFLAEFGLDLVVLKLRNDGMVVRKTLRQLLPNAFVPNIVAFAQGPKPNLSTVTTRRSKRAQQERGGAS